MLNHRGLRSPTILLKQFRAVLGLGRERARLGLPVAFGGAAHSGCRRSALLAFMRRKKQAKRREAAPKMRAARVVSTVVVEPPRVSPAVLAVDSLTRLFERSGWPSPDAFALAMRLHIEGVSPTQGERMSANGEGVQ